jgi:hypothetical protein
MESLEKRSGCRRTRQGEAIEHHGDETVDGILGAEGGVV